MDSLVSNAVHDFLSSAAFDLHLPSLSDVTWNTAFLCTESEFDTRRSGALSVLYAYIHQALARAAAGQDSPPNLKQLLDFILSNDILARVLVKAGVHDSYAGQENKQASRAFLVFVEMVVIDRGVPEFVSWIAQTFDPIVSVAFGASSTCQSAGETPSKRPLLSEDDGASKRRRIGTDIFEPARPASTFTVLQRLRRRQMLSISGIATSEILVVLDGIPTRSNLERNLAKKSGEMSAKSPPPMPQPANRVPIPAGLARMSPRAEKDTNPRTLISYPQDHNMAQATSIAFPVATASSFKSESTSTISAMLPCDATTTIGSSFVPATSRNREIPPIPAQCAITPTTQISRAPPVASSSCLENTITNGNDPAVPKDLHQAAVLFINETIEMVKCGGLLPTPILDAALGAHGAVVKNSSNRLRAEPKSVTKKKHQNQVTKKENLEPVSNNKKAKRRKANMPLGGGVGRSDRVSPSTQKKIMLASRGNFKLSPLEVC
ncbi:hypothetical protein DFH09DRAFT_1149889 [Mycena vulgaris]|nr:hypothetical protein DFH09DRAFT_1149889 [Mycena vulgaris]